MSKKFVHLHLHTEYSLLDGLSKTKKLVNHIKENDMDTVAITDHGVMYGAIDFYKACKKEDIKPIIGMEAYITNVALNFRGDRKKIKNYHLLLLAKDMEGYKNLMKLTSIAHLDGYYYRPRIDHKTLAKYSKGLICTSACAAGEVAQALNQDDYKKAKKVVKWHQDVFGKDYYLEVQRHDYSKHAANASVAEIRDELLEQQEYENKTNDGVMKLAKEMNISVIATNDAHYVEEGDAEAQDALVCIATGKNIQDIKRLRFIDAPAYFVSTPEQIEKKFEDMPEVLSTTVDVAEKCNVELTLGKFFFPKFDLPKDVTAEELLTKIANEGLKEKYNKINDELQKRLDYELEVINSKKYAAYFLIFQDMAQWSHKRHIPINIRGSVAGSLVSYVLGITTVDPIRFNLPFERFLNPFRPSAPDIDLDIADDMRGQMIEYLGKKYGKEKVGQICTFGRMLPRAAARDIARVMDQPYEVGDKIAKAIPLGQQGFPMTFERALKESSELKTMYDSDNLVRKIVDLAKEIEGNIRNVSVHAGGVVISPTVLTDFVPVRLDPKSEAKIITQYDMYACEDIGLVKLDVLGIRNLSILREAVQRVKVSTGKLIDLLSLPLDDKKTFEMLARGDTMGVFQLSGSGMTRYLVELAPEKIEDIMMMIALFRPGPMANIDEYIARKRGESPATYYHPKMESFLKNSLGVLVYQDDLLYTALEVAGYNWEEVDKFRKAVGKKIPEEMAKQHVKFVEGCVENSGMTKDEAEGLWDLFEPFQGYGFNKAHSASYGMVAYQTAYMKANFPVEYMAALLTAESNDTEKIAQAIAECRRMKIKVLPPDVNESEVSFKIVDEPKSKYKKAIRFGLSAIKNVGVAAIEAILEARDEGKFVSFADFCERVDARKVNKRVVESLIQVGGMSAFGNRAALLEIMDEVRSKARPKQTNGQQGLFEEEKKQAAGDDVFKITSNVSEMPEEELEILERKLLGFSLTAKPLDELLIDLIGHRTHRTQDITSNSRIKTEIKIAGVIEDVRIVTTKRTGAEMAFIKIKDETGVINGVVFPKIFDENRSIWENSKPILVSGKIDVREDSPSILIDTVDTQDTVNTKDSVFKVLIPEGTSTETLQELKKLLTLNPGSNKACLVFEENAGMEIDLPFSINWSLELSQQIANLLRPPELDGMGQSEVQ